MKYATLIFFSLGFLQYACASPFAKDTLSDLGSANPETDQFTEYDNEDPEVLSSDKPNPANFDPKEFKAKTGINPPKTPEEFKMFMNELQNNPELIDEVENNEGFIRYIKENPGLTESIEEEFSKFGIDENSEE